MRQRYRHAVIVLALRRAKDAVRHQIRAHGLKVSHYSAKEITVWAELYLDEHRDELLAEAKTTVERWTAEGVFGKRAQRAWFCETQSTHLRPSERIFKI